MNLIHKFPTKYLLTRKLWQAEWSIIKLWTFNFPTKSSKSFSDFFSFKVFSNNTSFFLWKIKLRSKTSSRTIRFADQRCFQQKEIPCSIKTDKKLSDKLLIHCKIKFFFSPNRLETYFVIHSKLSERKNRKKIPPIKMID